MGLVTIAQNNPKANPNDPSYFYWLYGFLDFKMADGEELGGKKVVRQIDRLADKLSRLDAKGFLLFDIIATRKHIQKGVPHRLGKFIYKHVEENYFTEITSTFVGLTDNPACRVARDVFCRNKDLSKQKYDFDVVDDTHMFVIYPPVENKGKDPTQCTSGFTASGHILHRARGLSERPSTSP
eukprot:TRINITY_DN86670_c0_g1_i1.p1 TRINITY_DN86670_c0_g1~~TRINITY_DN86670_c0_g1_i1.p1  ORF type:complete len:182 (+),score=8.55 TRINITY_DN86670_c0_g1_i1:579-1124(+)